MRAVLAIIILPGICFWFPIHAATVHVPADQPTIQAGIDSAVDGDTVLVSPGTYLENIDFQGKAIRVKSEAGAEVTVIDGSASVDPEYGCVVRFISGERRDSILDGFTLSGGTGFPIYFDFYYYAEYRYCGGAVYTEDSSPTICNNIMTGALDVDYGGGVYCNGSSPLIRDNTISGNDVIWYGGGIYCDGSAVIINNLISENRAMGGGGLLSIGRNIVTGNTISFNSAESGSGGGLSCNAGSRISRNLIIGNDARNGGGGVHASANTSSGDALITENVITGNTASSGAGLGCNRCAAAGNIISGNIAEDEGGGIYCAGLFRSPLVDNLVIGNVAGTEGGGVFTRHSNPVLINCTLADNSAGTSGGGLCADFISAVTVTASILWGNNASQGPQVAVTSVSDPSTLSIDYSDLLGGQGAIHLDDNCTLIWGNGMIDADPLFAAGPEGDHYLAQVAAGQPVDSPCIDGGNPASDRVCGTTRTDGVLDQGLADIGFRYPGQGRLVAGPGPGVDNPPVVRVLRPRKYAPLETEFMAYATPRYGVNVSCGDLDGDGVDEILTGAGPGPVFGAHVRGFTSGGTPLPGVSFIAYGTQKWGVNVSAGDLDGDGRDEIITGAGPGAVFGPHVRAFAWDGQTVSPLAGISYYAYGTLKWGVNVCAGDLDGDGRDEIITGAGPGAVFGPHVRAFAWDGQAISPVPGVSYFAYDTLRWGVNVACGDIDGDGIDEIITAPGPSAVFGADIRGWNVDGGTVSPLAGCSFFAWPPADQTYGARVFAGADLTGDGRNEIIVGNGPDPGRSAVIDVFLYNDDQIDHWLSLSSYTDDWTSGANGAAGNF